ncbi:MAG TPA: hypothetical protein VE359_07340 [Vicinamibacteria bacterium]|nr:hypothetical protein [Vicinamibacteria bacterium]
MRRPARALGSCLALTLLAPAGLLRADPSPAAERSKRVEAVRRIPGLVAFWDFVLCEAEGPHRFLAHTAGDVPAFPLDATNYVRTYWGEGREATNADFPRLGRGPFGEAVRFVEEESPDFRPTLLVPRAALHDTGLDVKGPGASVSMAVWMVRHGGNHAIAGIWHEGTDLEHRSRPAAKVQTGRRQYALFAGLAANDGASAVHVSENGRSSFGDRYARNLAATRRLIPTSAPDAPDAVMDAAWSVVGFVFDNERNTATAFLDGEAEDHWIEDPASHPFFQWPAKGWLQAQLRRLPGLQAGEEPDFPADQLYEPPETEPRKRTRVSATSRERVFDDTYAFTRVRVTQRRDADGRWQPASRELRALRVNPFWFPHDLYDPGTAEGGGPFTVGRVIHSSRGNGTRQTIGGVAVFGRALSAREMRRLAAIGRVGGQPLGAFRLLHAADPDH